jgi:TRAP-type mannitol/chloroaromatic compound transport system permease small subunit
VSAYTLGNDGHVRVDVLYRGFSERRKAWVNSFGVLFFLFPVAGALGWYSFDYVAASWRIGEGSREAGGIPALYLMKSLILIFVLLFFIQGISELLRNSLILLDKEPTLYKKEKQEGLL